MKDDSVLRFVPTAQALENIPHMLRYWADMVERDQGNGMVFDMAALILVQRGDCRPAFFIAGSPEGQDPHPLFASGVFDYCRKEMLSVTEREE